MGDPENPLSPDQVKEKARELLTASGLTSLQAQELMGTCLALPEGGELGSLWSVLQAQHQSQIASSAQASDSKRSS